MASGPEFPLFSRPDPRAQTEINPDPLYNRRRTRPLPVSPPSPEDSDATNAAVRPAPRHRRLRRCGPGAHADATARRNSRAEGDPPPVVDRGALRDVHPLGTLRAPRAPRVGQEKRAPD